MNKNKDKQKAELKNEFKYFMEDMKKLIDVMDIQSKHIQFIEHKVDLLENYVKLNLENKNKAKYIE